MSTYLELLQHAKRECRLTGSAPASVIGNAGVIDRLANWIKDAHTELQNRADWRWMRHTFTLPLVASQGAYTYSECTDVETSLPISRFLRWWLQDIEDPPKAYITSTGVGGEYWVTFHPWEHFKTVYRRNLQPESNVSVCSFDHQERINVGPIPSVAHTFTADYQLSPQILALDGDVPEMPERYHMVLVYLAMKAYGLIEGAPEVLIRGTAESNKIIRQMEINQMQRIRLGVPMA